MNVFDFDNTIYRGESTVDFFRFCLRKHPSLIRYLPSIFWNLLRYKYGSMTAERIIAKSEDVLRAFLAQMPNLDALVVEFWNRNEHKIKENFRAMIQEEDLILSGCAEILLREICGRLGVQRFLGTRVNLESGKIEFLCYNENKVKIFLEHYPTETIDHFYSDSLHDQPMVRLAKTAFFVRGDKIIPWAEIA